MFDHLFNILVHLHFYCTHKAAAGGAWGREQDFLEQANKQGEEDGPYSALLSERACTF